MQKNEVLVGGANTKLAGPVFAERRRHAGSLRCFYMYTYTCIEKHVFD
jgi:hypothetical protein